MNHARRIIDLQRREGFRRAVCTALREYSIAGRFLEDFEKDYGCTIIFDECHLKSLTGIDAIYFENNSSKTAFMLRYDS